jgi:hypothetical protein
MGSRLHEAALGTSRSHRSDPSSEKEYDSEQWRRAASWIWKLREEQTDSVIRSGAMNYLPAKHGSYAYDPENRFNEEFQRLTESLLPKTVRVMPRSVVVALLAGFVFVIGPLDWWLLGRLRARRFTWLLFPVVTAGVAVTTMKLARHYLGEGHHRGALVLTDIAPDGRVRSRDARGCLAARRARHAHAGFAAFHVLAGPLRCGTGSRRARI